MDVVQLLLRLFGGDAAVVETDAAGKPMVLVVQVRIPLESDVVAQLAAARHDVLKSRADAAEREIDAG